MREIQNIKLDPNKPIPLHTQLSDFIRNELFRGGMMNQNRKMPTEMELCERFNVSRITVRTALRSLEEEGLLKRERGRGTFINVRKVGKWTGQLLGFSEIIEAAGYTPGARTLRHGIKKVLPKVAKEALKVESAWEISRLRFADSIAIAVENSYFPIDIGLVFEEKNLDKLLMYKVIEDELAIQINTAKQRISAVNADEELSELLNVPLGKALIHVERITCSTDYRKIEYLNAFYRPDFFEYNVDLKR